MKPSTGERCCQDSRCRSRTCSSARAARSASRDERRTEDFLMIGRAGALSIGLFLALCPQCLCGEPSSLEARLGPLAKAHKGKVAIAVKHLGTGETYSLNADEPMPTASLIKTAILVETYMQVQEAKLKLTDTMTLHD